MRHVVLFFVLISLFSLAGCGESADSEPKSDAGVVDSAASDVTVTVTDVTAEDTAAPVDTAPEDTAPICPGGAGCPCDANDDCDAGLCLEGAEGKRCGKPCVDACEAGFSYAQVFKGSDVVTVYVEAWAPFV